MRRYLTGILCCGSAALLSGAVIVSGCGREPAPVDVDTSRASEFGYQTSVRTSLIEEGKVAYTKYCAGCHGEEGNGRGPASGWLHPRPRNFQKANFKFSSTRSGRLPRDEDLRRTIVEGLKGSAMPGWDLLPPRTVTALIAYLKTFSPKWEERGHAPPIPVITDPWRGQEDKSEAIARGEAVYHGFATCWTCHPSYVDESRINEHLVAMENPTRDAFRDNLFQSEAKPNSEGEVIYPPDFHRDYLRSGADVDDLYRSIAAGITGTAMPTWIDSMEIPASHGEGMLTDQKDVWAMAYYVQSLVLARPQKLAEGEFDVRDRKQVIHIGPAPELTPQEETDTDTGVEFDEDAEEFIEE